MSYNKVILEGNACSDVELRQTASGKSVCQFNLAVDRYSAEKQTDFFKIVAWGQTAEYCARTVRKGAPVLFAGTVQTRSWTDREGIKRSEVEFIAEHIRAFGAQTVAQTPTFGHAEHSPATPEERARFRNTPDTDFEDVTDDGTLPF